MMEFVQNMQVLNEKTSMLNQPYWIAFLGNFSNKSKQAEAILQEIFKKYPDQRCFSIETATDRETPRQFAIEAVPALIMLQKNQVKKRLLGLASAMEYEQFLSESLSEMGNRSSVPKKSLGQDRVTVYTTPTCSWCTRVKAYLRENRIAFTEIDVSQNEKIAQKLVKMTGQQGVPQIQVGSTYVVGFDKMKLDVLLGLKTAR